MEQRQTTRAIETFRWILALPVEYRYPSETCHRVFVPWFLSSSIKIYFLKSVEYLVAPRITEAGGSVKSEGIIKI